MKPHGILLEWPFPRGGPLGYRRYRLVILRTAKVSSPSAGRGREPSLVNGGPVSGWSSVRVDYRKCRPFGAGITGDALGGCKRLANSAGSSERIGFNTTGLAPAANPDRVTHP
jgi:hypothetical protein